jgi:aminoglycoside phosphotransferase (APT) family kinase protein
VVLVMDDRQIATSPRQRTSSRTGELDQWLRSWHDNHAADEQVGWMHRDFFPGNILCRQGEIVGLVDWDEVEWGPLITELAWSVWEFGKSPTGDTLLLDRALEFLGAYRRAGGPIEPSNSLIPLIRDRLRRGVAFWSRVYAEGHNCRRLLKTDPLGFSES